MNCLNSFSIEIKAKTEVGARVKIQEVARILAWFDAIAFLLLIIECSMQDLEMGSELLSQTCFAC